MPENSSASPAADNLAEQVIAPALRRRLQECYDHGTKLMEQGDYDHDYAHSILAECVSRDAGNIVYLDAFLENLSRQAGLDSGF